MGIDDFLGGEFNDLNDNQKKLIKNLFDLHNLNDNLESELDFNKSGLFMHELDSKEAAKELKDLIDENKMTQEIKFIESYEGKIIEEIWTSENQLIKVKRYYPFTYENINMLPNETRRHIYDSLLDKALEKENYEEAAQIRDGIIINE